MDDNRRRILSGLLAAGACAFEAGAVSAAAPADIAARASVKSFGAIGDGTADDTDAIDRAIASLHAGGCLYFPAGFYMISRSLAPLPRNTAVICDEGAWLKRRAGAPNVVFFTVRGDNDLVVNIDGGDQVEGNWLTESFGIHSEAKWPAERVRVSRSRFLNLSTGIRADGALQWQVFSNYFENMKNCGVLAGADHDAPVKYNVFNGNLFSRMGDYAIAFYPIRDGDCEIGFCNVIGNIARNTQMRTSGFAFGIEAGIRNSKQHNNAFIGNIVEQTIDSEYVQGGIVLGNCTRDSVVSSNVLKGHRGKAQSQGINCPLTNNIQIFGNQVSEFSGPGIRTDGATYVQIANNIIRNCGGRSQANPAILIALKNGASAIQVIENFIECVEVAGATAIAGYAASGQPASDWMIRSNSIASGVRYGIYLAGAWGSRLQRSRVVDNDIGGSEGSTALLILRADRIRVIGNTAPNPKVGFIIDDCAHVDIDGNYIFDDRASPRLSDYLQLSRSFGIRLRNNTFEGGSDASLIGPAGVLAGAEAIAHNVGLATESSGTTPPIESGTAIAHGLAVVPSSVVVTQLTPYPSKVYVEIGEKTFTIKFSGGGMHAFSWFARSG